MMLNDEVQRELIEAASSGLYASGYESLVANPRVESVIAQQAEFMVAMDRLRYKEGTQPLIKRIWVEGYGHNQDLCYELNTTAQFPNLDDPTRMQRRSLADLRLRLK